MSRGTQTIFGMAGVVLPFAGAVAPSGWLLCHGQSVSRADNAHLFSTIGTAFGTGDGTTTFNLPDLRGRVSAGKDNMGGAAANRLTGSVAGSTLGASGGSETHTLTESQMPPHVHGSGTNNGFWTDIGGRYVANAGGSVINLNTVPNTASAGSGSAHNNTQPTIVLNHIIKT